MFQLLFPLHFSFPSLVTCCAGLPSQEFDGQALEGISHFYGMGGSDNAEKVQSTNRRCFWHSFLWQTLPKLLLHCLPRAEKSLMAGLREVGGKGPFGFAAQEGLCCFALVRVCEQCWEPLPGGDVVCVLWARDSLSIHLQEMVHNDELWKSQLRIAPVLGRREGHLHLQQHHSASFIRSAFQMFRAEAPDFLI